MGWKMALWLLLWRMPPSLEPSQCHPFRDVPLDPQGPPSILEPRHLPPGTFPPRAICLPGWRVWPLLWHTTPFFPVSDMSASPLGTHSSPRAKQCVWS